MLGCIDTSIRHEICSTGRPNGSFSCQSWRAATPMLASCCQAAPGGGRHRGGRLQRGCPEILALHESYHPPGSFSQYARNAVFQDDHPAKSADRWRW